MKLLSESPSTTAQHPSGGYWTLKLWLKPPSKALCCVWPDLATEPPRGLRGRRPHDFAGSQLATSHEHAVASCPYDAADTAREQLLPTSAQVFRASVWHSASLGPIHSKRLQQKPTDVISLDEPTSADIPMDAS